MKRWGEPVTTKCPCCGSEIIIHATHPLYEKVWAEEIAKKQRLAHPEVSEDE